MTEAKPKAKKKKNVEEMRKELRDLAKKSEAPPPPPVDLKKLFVRVGAVLVVVWIVAAIVRHVAGYAIAGVLTAVAVGGGFWLTRFLKKQQALGALLRGADTEEGRKDALKQLETFGKDDSQALLAKAQLEMQEDPRKALATLETINLSKLLGPMADQVRSMRAMLHLTLHEAKEARTLADAIDISKQQDPKSRAMFAAVASEAWARTGDAKKASETLDLYNPEDKDLAELRVQLWRARAFTYAAQGDIKGVGRVLRKLGEASPQLLGMFMGSKKIHPLLEREAKQLLMRSGAMPRKMVRQKM